MTRFMPEDWPIPQLDRFNRDFFTAGKLVVQQCVPCGTVQHPPDAACHACKAMEFRSWRPTARARSTPTSSSTTRPRPRWPRRCPYAVALVALDEHPHIRILGNVLNCEPGEVAIGQRVRATFEEVIDEDETLLMPQWELV